MLIFGNVTFQGDQASIIGGAINFVKELEQLLQCMKGQQRMKENGGGFSDSSSPFAEFFMFPQYSTRATQNGRGYPSTCEARSHSWAVADIEVTLVDGHANIKILSKKQPGLLLKMVVGLQTLAFTILHLNVTTVDDMVLTSVSVKVGFFFLSATYLFRPAVSVFSLSFPILMQNVHSFLFSSTPFLCLSFSLLENFYDTLGTTTNFTNGDTGFC